jgi:hypothetical protein
MTFMNNPNMLLKGGSGKSNLVDVNSEMDFPSLGGAAATKGPPREAPQK